MRNKWLILVVLFVAFGLAGCVTDTTTSTTTTSDTTTTSTTTTTTSTSTTTTTEAISTTTTEELTTTQTTTEEVTTTVSNHNPEFSGTDDSTSDQGYVFDPLAGVSASDFEDGDLTGAIIVTENNVDTAVLGTYTVTYSVTDSDGNNVTVTRDITIIVHQLTGEEKAALDVAALSFPTEIGEIITLPSYGSHGTVFRWNSLNTLVITDTGFVLKPPVGSDPVTVTMHARVINGSYIGDAYFDFVVQPYDEVSVTSSESVAFEGTSEEYVVANDEDVTLYFVDNGSLPYIDVATFIAMVNGAVQADILTITPEGTDGLRISYDIEFEDFDGSIVTESYWAYIDFTLNTFTVNNFDFFGGYVAETSSDYGEGLTYLDADYVTGEEVTIPLGDYNFDLVMYDDNGTMQYLMPVSVTDLLFLGGIYYDVYYNGDKLWGIDTFSISGDDTALFTQIRTSSLNTATMPDDVRWASYNFYALAFNYFYGLKEDTGVENYYTFLNQYAQSMMTSTDKNFYYKAFQIAYGLDDLHTSYVFPGFYERTSFADDGGVILDNLGELGVRSQAFYEGLWAMQDLLEARWGSTNTPDFHYLEDGKTVVIHITGFTIDTPDEFKTILDGLKGGIENVVIDLSYNTGGNVGAVFRMFGYMTESTFQYHSQNPADNSAVTYYIESDYVAYDFNWYVVTSSVTFSAANLFASMAKESGVAVVMGQPSSGGASSIGAIYGPDGSCMLISTNNVISTRTGNEVDGYTYSSVEYGITPDYLMENPVDDAEILDIIAQDQGLQ